MMYKKIYVFPKAETIELESQAVLCQSNAGMYENDLGDGGLEEQQ